MGGFFVKEVWNLTNKRFGKLTAIEDSGQRTKSGNKIWKCECECGNHHLARGDMLRSGDIKSCGCLKIESAKKNIKNIRKKHTDKLSVEGTLLSVIQESRKINKNNTSGVNGVRWNKHKGKWCTTIGFKGKDIYLGAFMDKQDAINARLKAEEEYYKPILDKYKEKIN
jgi:hypothetical protein